MSSESNEGGASLREDAREPRMAQSKTRLNKVLVRNQVRKPKVTKKKNKPMDGYKNNGWYRNQNRKLQRMRQAAGATPDQSQAEERNGSSVSNDDNKDDGASIRITDHGVGDTCDGLGAAPEARKVDRSDTAGDNGEQQLRLTRKQQKKIAHLARKFRMREARSEAIEAATPALVDRTRKILQ